MLRTIVIWGNGNVPERYAVDLIRLFQNGTATYRATACACISPISDGFRRLHKANPVNISLGMLHA